jgi:hypothetical protein
MLTVRPAIRRHLGLAAVLAGGAAIRLWFMRSYRPAFLGYPDARPYLIAARGPLYWNQYKPVGYPLLLRALRRLDGRLSATIAAQHALGLGTVVLAHGAVSPQLRRRSPALLPAAVVAFGGSQVWLEHSVLSDGPYTFLLAGILCCAQRSARPVRAAGARRGWLAGAGTLLGASLTLRTAGVFLVPVLGGWAGARARPRERLGDALAVLLPCGALLLAYLTPQARRTGRWGLTRSGSFALYGRMAPLADPSRFVAPPGTQTLVQGGDPLHRPNLNWYLFDRESPAIRLYGDPPYPLDGDAPPAAYRWAGEEPTRRFARAVLRQQPLDYLRSVAEGMANYVRPRTGRRSIFEYDQRLLIANLHDSEFEALALADVAAFYTTPPGYRRRGVERLEAYGIAMRTEGWPTALLVALAAAGAGGGSTWWLFALSALALAAGPVAVLFYDVRYAAPMVVPLSAAAAIGLDRLLDRLCRA